MTFEQELVGLWPRLFSRACQFTRSIDDASDLVQDTVMKALANKDKFRVGSNLTAWTFTIMRNRFFEQRRKAGRIVEDPDNYATDNLPIDPPQEPREEFRDVWAAFQMLPQTMQQALYLVGILGSDYEEASEILGVPLGTIKSRVSRARTKLEQVLS